MEVKAILRRVRIAPRKARLVVDAVRNAEAIEAKRQLQVMPKDAASVVLKLLNSAIANAEHNNKLKAEDLYIARAFVDEGPTLKRWMPRAFGRATQILKRTSHITLVLSEKKEALERREVAEKKEASKPTEKHKDAEKKTDTPSKKRAPKKDAAPKTKESAK